MNRIHYYTWANTVTIATVIYLKRLNLQQITTKRT